MIIPNEKRLGPVVVCMYVQVITYSKSKDFNRVRLPILLVVSWTGKIFPVRVRTWEFGLARRVWQSVPSRVGLLISILRLSLVLTYYEIPPEFRGGVHLFIYNRHDTPSSQSRVYRVTQLRTDGVHCRESAGTEPVNLKVVPNGWAALARSPWTKWYAPFFLKPTIILVWSGHVESTGVIYSFCVYARRECRSPPPYSA